MNRLIAQLINLYMIVLLVRCVMSFFPRSRFHPAGQLVYRATDPVLRPFQRAIPPIGGALDITPLVVLLILGWLRNVFLGMP